MRSVRYSDGADDDVVDIVAYTTTRFGPEQADKYIDELESAIELLATYPELGMKLSSGSEGRRRFVHARHAIYYRASDTEILVLRILGPGQDPTRDLG